MRTIQVNSVKTFPINPFPNIFENLECQSPISQDKLAVVVVVHYDGKYPVFEDLTIEINTDLQVAFS